MSKISKGMPVDQEPKQEDVNVYVSIFKNVKSGKPQKSRESSWGDWCSHLCDKKNRRVLSAKEDAPLFSGAEFEGSRSIANVKHVTQVMLDFDDGILLEQLPETSQKYEYAAYSTYNHSEEKSKFRVILPLRRPVSAPEYDVVWEKANEIFGDRADQNAKDAARISYLPSCPPEKEEQAFAVHNEGVILDPDVLLIGFNFAEKSKTNTERPDMEQGYPDGQRTKELLRRAGYCLGVDDMPEDEAVDACLAWNEHNTPPLADEKVISTVKSLAKGNAQKLMNEPWDELQPIISKAENGEPYPVDSLPEVIHDVVIEVGAFIQAPVSMVAMSAIAAVSVAAQALANVRRDKKLVSPVSLYSLVIADSGERKSTCDNFFMTAIRDYEKDEDEKAQDAKRTYQAQKKAYDIKESALCDKIKQEAKAGKDTSKLVLLLEKLQREEPIRPLMPRILFSDVTSEALTLNLAQGWSSGGVFSSEAGMIFGGHSMKADNIMLSLSVFNTLWDGTPFHSDRKTSESFKLFDARLTMGLQTQAATIKSFIDTSHGLPRGMGFMARILFAWPQSTQGTRFYKDAPETWPCLAHYHDRIKSMLHATKMLPSRRPDFRELELSDEAKSAWVAFHDNTERELGNGGALYDVRDAASKITDNAARLAALFHLFEGKDGSRISRDHMLSACRIVSWHLSEARRFFGEIALPEDLREAMRLERWLINSCQKKGAVIISTRDARQRSPVRDGKTLTTALRILEEMGHVRVIRQGKRRDIYCHPDFLSQPA